jgi:tRNA pseudouridine55 synthase
MSTSRIAWRDLHGLILLDKPQGMSSNQALQAVRRLLRAAKGGHTGSLDPLATGMLPICLGEATKLAGGLLGSAKAYTAIARLGECTDTDDAEGRVIGSRLVPALTMADIERALAPLRGQIQQFPPAYSALKRDGEPLYAKARRGEDVQTVARTVNVYSLVATGLALPLVHLEIECGSGTYVRSLVRDMGEALGCGAHVVALRRAWVDPFRDDRMVTLEQLQAANEAGREALLLPIERGLAAWPPVLLDAEQALLLGQGRTCRVEPAPSAGEVGLWLGERGLGIGLSDGHGELRPRRLFTWAAAGSRP